MTADQLKATVSAPVVALEIVGASSVATVAELLAWPEPVQNAETTTAVARSANAGAGASEESRVYDIRLTSSRQSVGSLRTRLCLGGFVLERDRRALAGVLVDGGFFFHFQVHGVFLGFTVGNQDFWFL